MPDMTAFYLMDTNSTISPAPAYDYDSIPQGYYDSVYHRRKGAQSKWHHMEYVRVGREIPAGSAHLDVGCGPGTFASSLPATIRSTSMDIALPQIEYARKFYAAPNRVFETMEPAKIPCPDETFDVVTSLELVEHITEDEGQRLLKECARVLKKGGRLVVTTPNYSSAWPLLEWVVNSVTPVTYKYQHITKYKKPTLHKLLEEAGLEVVDVAGFQFSAPFYAMLSWKLADWVGAIEPAFVTRNLGNLLIGIARKP